MKNCGVETRQAGSKGKGVFAAKYFKRGELVVCGKVTRVVGNRTDYSFQVDIDKHVDLDEPARLINHSCNPNLGLQDNQFRGFNFIALKDIREGEEVCWDYCMSEYQSIAIKSKCQCGSDICRRTISGYKDLPEEIRRKYNRFVASYIRRRKL